MDFLYSIDKAVFLFINQTIANPVGDILWPMITHYDRFLVVRIVLATVWILLIVKGGKNGRTVAFLLIPVLLVSDKLSSEVIKELIDRPRPCHEIDGRAVVRGIHLLVHCGPGKSLPSSHAVNNFAVAFLFLTYFPNFKWWFLGWAALVALSRPAVGVHYPSDILLGAALGMLIAFTLIWLWKKVEPLVLSRFSKNDPVDS